MIKIRRASAIAAGAVAALAIGGGTAALAAGADDPAPSPSSDDRVAVPMAPNGDSSLSASRRPSSSASSGQSVSADRAKAIAMKVAGGGRVVKVEGDVEHGRAVWDVYVLVKGVTHDIDVDRSSGSVTRHQVKGAVRAGGTDDGVNHDRNDDKGGARKNVRNEAGDDNGGTRRTVRHEAGDDKGGNRRSGTDDGVKHDDGAKHDVGDDKGGNGGKSGKSSDDKGGDDHGSGGHGSDD
jgi:hypothetical protein